MTTNPTVACVITNYNYEKYLLTAIKSVLSQTIIPNEIIVVDDCGQDNSAELAKEFLHTQEEKFPNTAFRVLKHTQNLGLPSSRNTGIKNSVSDIIAFLDADDYYYPTKIEKSLEIFRKYKEVGAVYSDYDMEDLRTGVIEREFKPPFDARLLWQFCMVSTNSIMKRDMFKICGVYDPDVKVAEDYELWLRVAPRFMIYHIPEALFRYRIHGGNITLNRQEEMANNIRSFKQKYAHIYTGQSV